MEKLDDKPEAASPYRQLPAKSVACGGYFDNNNNNSFGQSDAIFGGTRYQTMIVDPPLVQYCILVSNDGANAIQSQKQGT